ncbi:HNH endonuclease [Gilliamella sp. B3781]|nr:HNH endonuclease [Gilliamella sp. B3835]MCX8706391.1 HNH endonuclease [Gilliamella sp. B3783]MCX8709132.1 HNH endonuclease [Gilliamella sp. B3780]MCX8714439.1 HNH endonuclease [Gilliamella sp. B3781]MCX8717123.1 HNH endonuclease [Gilliamella sp. B3784]MCX8717920.1 HNH endonuclease [Gilliamella sp. B3788]MCX8729180.1 HNH endonuclease [Gilliamella sp. B2969]
MYWHHHQDSGYMQLISPFT